MNVRFSLITALLLSLTFTVSCSTLKRNPSSLEVANNTPKAIVFVHGFGGDKVIERVTEEVKSRNGDQERAKFGEYNAFYDAFHAYIETHKLNVTLVPYRYDTRTGLNVNAAKVLNQLVSKTEAGFKPKESFVITLSNGNLVTREAVTQSAGGQDENLKAFWSHTSIHDVSPILGGASDARGTLPVVGGRFREIDPFGKNIARLFSNELIRVYDSSITDHYTYLVCGDPYTRGIWNFLTHEHRSNAKYDPALYLSALVQDKTWIKNNLKYLSHFEKARGQQDHHIEYIPDFGTDSYCNPEDYLRGNEALEARINQFKIQDSEFASRVKNRFSRKNQNYFMSKMPASSEHYFLDHFKEIYPASTKINPQFLGGLNHDGDHFEQLNERHTVLVYYKPLIKTVGERIFGEAFGEWYANKYLQSR